MPIRINFLAERQAEDEVRRRDPVKRAMLAAAGLIAVMLVWGGSRQYELLRVRREADHYRRQISALTNYSEAVRLKNQLVVMEQRLQDLRKRAADRFLWAPVLHALQYATVANVHLVRLRGQQQYTEAAKGTNVAARAPITGSLRISITGQDRQDGNQISQFQSAIAAQPYFATNLAKAVELEGRGPRTEDPEAPGKPYVEFYLNCDFRERTF